MQDHFLVITPVGGERDLDNYINRELFASLLAIPSATRVMLLRLIRGNGPSQVVIWETERWEASVTRAYDVAIGSDSASASALAGRPRAVYQGTARFRQTQVVKDRCKFLLLVQMDIPLEHENEFNNWYDSEHIPMLLKIPGWMSAVRYVLINGEVPKYLTIYELEGPGAVDRTEHEMTHRTEWYRRVRPHFENFSSLLYEQLSESQRK